MSGADDAPVDHLLSLLRWIEQTERITQKTPYDRFGSDVIGQFAFRKSIERCGKIVWRIDKRWPDFVAAHPEIEIKRVQAVRNRIARGYESLDLDLVRGTAPTSIPEMGRGLKTVLSKVSADERP